jgi:hypothetical protein
MSEDGPSDGKAMNNTMIVNATVFVFGTLLLAVFFALFIYAVVVVVRRRWRGEKGGKWGMVLGVYILIFLIVILSEIPWLLHR